MKKFLFSALAAVTLSASFASFAAQESPAVNTVVLVHGAFADGSSWNRVIPLLQSHHIKVIAVQLPLTSLQDDVAATQRAIDRAPGNVVLVGHSWGGTVITEAGNNPRVKGLVYVAAFAPSVGQSTGDLAGSYPSPPGSAGIAKTPDGFLYLPAPTVAQDFAQDSPVSQQKRLTVTQGPIRAAAFGDKVSHAAWTQKPSWYLVSTEDRMINPDLERAMAQRIHASVSSVAASHTSMLSHPTTVAQVITRAVAGVNAQ
ncbi:alpha/beta hydrolase [Pantoea sp.]|uniref:alpha/beta fold hydrolase n=1 Tax=Pantoea sp. TaxID=69393 RepID=UPI0028A73820|nr:alpha/beta hydrolase [Pantoea sp.]